MKAKTPSLAVSLLLIYLFFQYCHLFLTLSIFCIQLVLSWPQNMTEGDDILLPIPGTEETFHFNCGMLKNQKDTDAMYFCFDTYECEKYLNSSHEEIVDDLTTSFMDEMLGYTYYYIALGGATWFLATIQTGGLMLQVRAQHQTYKSFQF